MKFKNIKNNLSEIFGNNWNKLNYQECKSDLLNGKSISNESYLVKILLDGADKITLTRGDSEIEIGILNSGFLKGRKLSCEMNDIEEIIAGGDTLDVNGETMYIRKNQGRVEFSRLSSNIDMGLSKEFLDEFAKGCQRATGVITITGNYRANLDGVFNYIKNEYLTSQDHIASVDISGGNYVIDFDGTMFSGEVDKLVDVISSLSLSRVILSSNDNELARRVAFDLSSRGTLVFLLIRTPSSVHEFMFTLSQIEATVVSSNLIGIMGVCSVPSVKVDSLKSLRFEQDQRYAYYRKLDSSPMPKEVVFEYGSGEYSKEKITDLIDLVDYINAPNDIVELSKTPMTTFDHYSKLKLQSWDAVLDSALKLVRMKKTTLDLVDYFVSRY